MLFTHDTEQALQAAAALINSADADPDSLATLADLEEFVTSWGFTGSRTRDDAELATLRRVRGRLRELWLAEELEQVAQVNRLLRDASALPQLVKHDNWDWHLHATTDDRPLAERIAVEVAMALVDVIRAGETERLRRCAAPDCGLVLVDLSRNRSRRFCDAGCGNRLAAAAYRARKAEEEG